ncbi:MAG: hypothetical protein FWF46_00830 [Oscillospiraceae bacterium]|nr:hypothetical protein [Oscillospiraceae bacterium]
MNKDKLKSIINKKAEGDNDMSMQLYQMFFFEHILENTRINMFVEISTGDVITPKEILIIQIL